MNGIRKTILTVTGIILLAVSFAPVVQAQNRAPEQNTGTAGNSGSSPASASTADTNTASKIATTPQAAQPQMDGIIANIVQWIVSWFAWLLGLAAVLLDYAVFYTVVKMGEYVNQLSAIGVVWRIFRDIGNIALIFGFLAIGISIILGDAVKFGYGKTMLPTLLLVAVTLNFSMFAAEAVIDTGNMFATQIYQQIRGGQAAGTADAAGIGNEGISNRVMAQLGLQTIYGNALKNKALYQNNSSLIVGLLSIILFLVAAMIFFSLAFILVFRFIALVLVIMTSPIGFAGFVVPKLGAQASKWWGHLTNQTLTAPVLLLLLYVALAVITDVKFLAGFGVTNTDSWTASLGLAGGAVAGMLLSFIVAMGLLAQVAVAAKSLGAAGADIATNFGKKLSFDLAAKGVGGMVNLGGYAARRGLQASGYTGRGAQTLMSGALLAQGVRGDIRNIPGVGRGLQAAGLGAAARPVAQSVTAQVTGARDWAKGMSKESQKSYEREMKIPLLQNAKTDTDRARLIRAMTDDELKSDAMTKYFIANPAMIQQLAPQKLSILSRDVLTSQGVGMALTREQIKYLEKNGNFDEETRSVVSVGVRANKTYVTMYNSSKDDRQKELDAYFGKPIFDSWNPNARSNDDLEHNMTISQ